MINQLKRVAHNNTPRWVVLTLDLLLATLSFGLACLIIDAFSVEDLILRSYFPTLLIVLAIRLLSFLVTKSYTGIIRYTSTQDAVQIFFAVAMSTFIISTCEVIYYGYTDMHLIKPSIIVIDAFILVFFLSAFRIAFKLLYNQYAPFNSGLGNKELVIYGSGEAGIIVKRSFERNSKLGRKVIAFIDDNPKLQGKSVEGVKIYSPDVDFDNLIAHKKNVELVIAIDKISGIRKKRIIEKCLQHNIVVKTIPPVSAWIDGEFNPHSIKNVNIEDLLEREPIKLSKGKISNELKDQVILITGAAGSIGSEIARQCLVFGPKN